jgi:nucleotide-binding universal stress UspA family protein
MVLKDILLTLWSYPEPTPVPMVEAAAAWAAALGGKLSVITAEVEIRAPGTILPDTLLDIPAMVAAEEKKSANSARNLLAEFRRSANKRGVFQEQILEQCRASDVPALFAEYARLRDLTIVPVPAGDPSAQWYAESIIFDSGRPIILLSPGADSPGFDRVVVAWDGSRTAARALSDAMPILEKAHRIYVLTVTNEKVLPTMRSASPIVQYFSRRGIEVVLDEVDAAGRKIGAVLESHVLALKADLLVMGAYGHSRLREFVLGGATQSVLARPPVPVLLSH